MLSLHPGRGRYAEVPGKIWWNWEHRDTLHLASVGSVTVVSPLALSRIQEQKLGLPDLRKLGSESGWPDRAPLEGRS